MVESAVTSPLLFVDESGHVGHEPSPMASIPIVESRWLDRELWGHMIAGTIFTYSAERLAKNIHNLGICPRTGRIDLLPGKVAA